MEGISTSSRWRCKEDLGRPNMDTEEDAIKDWTRGTGGSRADRVREEDAGGIICEAVNSHLDRSAGLHVT
jgi:hypothetical protein